MPIEGTIGFFELPWVRCQEIPTLSRRIVRVLKTTRCRDPRAGAAVTKSSSDVIISRPEIILRVQPPLADKLYRLYPDQYYPELTPSDPVVEDLLAVGTFRLKEKPKTAQSLESVRDWTFADKASDNTGYNRRASLCFTYGSLCKR